mgnify:CR=1 FL=1
MASCSVKSAIFDVSALVVWEWYYSPRYMHLKPERITADLDDETVVQTALADEKIARFLEKTGGALRKSIVVKKQAGQPHRKVMESGRSA